MIRLRSAAEYTAKYRAGSKVKKDSKPYVRCGKTAQQLREVRVNEFTTCLRFDYHTAFDEHVDAMDSDLLAVKEHLHWKLALYQ